MKCLIIDDDPSIRLILRSLIEEVDFLELRGECENAIQGFNFLTKEKVDLLFLDIEMPKMSGLEFLDSLDNKPLVIICTSKRDYAVDAFEHQAVDYLVKPLSEKRFLTAVAKAKDIFENSQQIYNNNKDFIFIKDKGVHTKIRYNDILYVQAMGDYMKIFTAEKWFVLHSTMKALEEILPKNIFFRTHRSFIINVNNLDRIEDNIAYIKKTPIVIGDMYKQSLIKKLHSL